jgi:dipeptidyl aminopeptidase/acylaminoacyl peptidase
MRPKLKAFRSDMYDVDSTEENRKRSALYFYKSMNRTPVIIFHGTADKHVSPLDSLELAQLLQSNNHPYSLHMIDEEDHLFKKSKSFVFKTIQDWFNKHS